jgi:oligoribonuclease
MAPKFTACAPDPQKRFSVTPVTVERPVRVEHRVASDVRALLFGLRDAADDDVLDVAVSRPDFFARWFSACARRPAGAGRERALAGLAATAGGADGVDDEDIAHEGLQSVVRSMGSMRRGAAKPSPQRRLGYARVMADTAPPLVWVDLEMTGLDPDTCVIVEIATMVTSSDLSESIEGPVAHVHQSPRACSRHGAGGARSARALRPVGARLGVHVSLAEAEGDARVRSKAHVARARRPCAATAMWKDKRSSSATCRSVVQHLHYRIVDVSTIKELVRRWYPEPFQAPKKRETHRALDDIRESIDELQHYRSKVFAPLS